MDDRFPPEWLSESHEVRKATPLEAWAINEVFDLRSRVKDLERLAYWLLFSTGMLGLASLLRFVAWVL